MQRILSKQIILKTFCLVSPAILYCTFICVASHSGGTITKQENKPHTEELAHIPNICPNRYISLQLSQHANSGALVKPLQDWEASYKEYHQLALILFVHKQGNHKKIVMHKICA